MGKTVVSSPAPSAFLEQSSSNTADNVSLEEETVTIDLDGTDEHTGERATVVGSMRNKGKIK